MSIFQKMAQDKTMSRDVKILAKKVRETPQQDNEYPPDFTGPDGKYTLKLTGHANIEKEGEDRVVLNFLIQDEEYKNQAVAKWYYFRNTARQSIADVISRFLADLQRMGVDISGSMQEMESCINKCIKDGLYVRASIQGASDPDKFTNVWINGVVENKPTEIIVKNTEKLNKKAEEPSGVSYSPGDKVIYDDEPCLIHQVSGDVCDLADPDDPTTLWWEGVALTKICHA